MQLKIHDAIYLSGAIGLLLSCTPTQYGGLVVEKNQEPNFDWTASAPDSDPDSFFFDSQQSEPDSPDDLVASVPDGDPTIVSEQVSQQDTPIGDNTSNSTSVVGPDEGEPTPPPPTPIVITPEIKGDVTFEVETISYDGKYEPKNAGVIWVETGDGEFVRTLKVWAKKRDKYLYDWEDAYEDASADEDSDDLDAVTGATKKSHDTRDVSWSRENWEGDIVEPGDYIIQVEFTEKNGSGKRLSVPFQIGGGPHTLTPEDRSYFRDIILTSP